MLFKEKIDSPSQLIVRLSNQVAVVKLEKFLLAVLKGALSAATADLAGAAKGASDFLISDITKERKDKAYLIGEASFEIDPAEFADGTTTVTKKVELHAPKEISFYVNRKMDSRSDVKTRVKEYLVHEGNNGYAIFSLTKY